MPDLTPESILACINDKLSVPERWTKGLSQRVKYAADGLTVQSHSFCLLGAAASCSGSAAVMHEDIPDAVLNAIYDRLPDEAKEQADDGYPLSRNRRMNAVVYFNDKNSTTHGDVIEVIRLALADVRETA